MDKLEIMARIFLSLSLPDICEYTRRVRTFDGSHIIQINVNLIYLLSCEYKRKVTYKTFFWYFLLFLKKKKKKKKKNFFYEG